MKRIGILTSGGDCQGLNASIRGVAKSLYEEFGNDVEIYGIKDGYKGLIFGEYKLMKPEDFSGILTLGGTILGTSRQPFKLMRVIDENSVDIAVLAVPESSAQDVADLLCETRIKGIMNFSPASLITCDSIEIRQIDLAVSLEGLSYRIKNKYEE